MKTTIVKQKTRPSFFFEVNGTVPTPRITCVILTHLPTHLHSGIKISVLSTYYIEISVAPMQFGMDMKNCSRRKCRWVRYVIKC